MRLFVMSLELLACEELGVTQSNQANECGCMTNASAAVPISASSVCTEKKKTSPILNHRIFPQVHRSVCRLQMAGHEAGPLTMGRGRAVTVHHRKRALRMPKEEKSFKDGRPIRSSKFCEQIRCVKRSWEWSKKPWSWLGEQQDLIDFTSGAQKGRKAAGYRAVLPNLARVAAHITQSMPRGGG